MKIQIYNEKKDKHDTKDKTFELNEELVLEYDEDPTMDLVLEPGTYKVIEAKKDKDKDMDKEDDDMEDEEDEDMDEKKCKKSKKESVLDNEDKAFKDALLKYVAYQIEENKKDYEYHVGRKIVEIASELMVDKDDFLLGMKGK